MEPAELQAYQDYAGGKDDGEDEQPAAQQEAEEAVAAIDAVVLLALRFRKSAKMVIVL